MSGHTRPAPVPSVCREGLRRGRCVQCHSLATFLSQLMPFPHSVLIQVLSPRKDSNSKTPRSKTLTPVPPEKKAQESSESSDEEWPSSQVGHAFFLQLLGAQSRLVAGEGGCTSLPQGTSPQLEQCGSHQSSFPQDTALLP